MRYIPDLEKAKEGPIAARNAAGQLRLYDGIVTSPSGKIIGIEVKSGSAIKTPAQRTFDLGVIKSNPATGVGESLGIEIRRTVEIRR